MKLSVKERLVLRNILAPQQSSLEDMIRIKSINDQIVLSSKDLDDIKYATVGNRSDWDETKDPFKDIKLEKGEIELLKSIVAIIDREKKVTQDSLELCQKINLL